jgi:uncharacterized membrane protein
MTRLRIAGLSTLLADGAATILAWSRMPARVPVHWNIRGEVDRIGSRLELLLLGPLLLLFLWGVFEVLGVIDPRIAAPRDPEKTEAERSGALQTAFALLLCLVFALHVILLLHGMGILDEPRRIIALWLAAFLLLFGNFMGRLRPSWFVGIRTPWTLSSDDVWRRTHRLAARLMVGGGGLLLLLALVLPPQAALVAGIVLVLACTLAPAVVSFFWWRATRSL